MSNEQLKILLNGYANQLSMILNKIEKENPNLKEKVITLGIKTKRIKHLQPVWDFLSDIRNDIDLLEGKVTVSGQDLVNIIDTTKQKSKR